MTFSPLGLQPVHVLRPCWMAGRPGFARGRLHAVCYTEFMDKDMGTTTFTKKTLGLETVEPAVTPPPPNSETGFTKKPKLGGGKSRKREIPEGLWTKCPKCSNMVFDKELDENLKVCPQCQHHFPIGARERVHSLVETCSFEEMDAQMMSTDVLEFKGVASYRDKLEAYQRNTSLKDAVITGIGKMAEQRVA